VLGDSELVIEGPATLVVNDLWLEPEAELRFDSARGPIELYVIQSLVFERGAYIETIRLGLDVTRRYGHFEIGLGAYHYSNAGMGEDNPGVESVLLTCSYAF
jgi:hypothetical protein